MFRLAIFEFFDVGWILLNRVTAYGAHLHWSFDYLKWLKYCSTHKTTNSTIEKSMKYIPLNIDVALLFCKFFYTSIISLIYFIYHNLIFKL